MKRSLNITVLLLVALVTLTVSTPASASFPPVKFVSVRSPVPQGGMGLVTIQTTPQTLCTITVNYKSGPSRAAGLIPKKSDSQGRITWIWKVGTRTTPGVWPIIVGCGQGDITRVRTSFEVT
jgi:micrococcal nuclease